MGFRRDGWCRLGVEARLSVVVVLIFGLCGMSLVLGWGWGQTRGYGGNSEGMWGGRGGDVAKY